MEDRAITWNKYTIHSTEMNREYGAQITTIHYWLTNKI